MVSGKLANLAAPRQIALTIFRNPTGSALTGYRTTLDPATIASKLNPGTAPEMIQIATPDDQIIQAKWQESYGTDIDDCKVWAKISPGATAPTPIILYDTPPGGDEDNEDDEHKTVVTDITLEKGYAVHLLYAGGATPDGWTLESGPGGYFENQFPVGAKAGLNADEDENAPTTTLVSCGRGAYQAQGSGGAITCCTGSHTHGIGSISTDAVSNVPQYKALKVIRANKIKAAIPTNAIIIFDNTVPTGFTRYSTQDGYYIRGGGTVGSAGGNATRRFLVAGTTGTYTANSYAPNYVGNTFNCITHNHTFSAYTDYINNDPPYINVILGIANNNLSYIPEGAILMFDETPPAEDWEVLSWGGKLLKGAATYGGTGGNATETPPNLIADTADGGNSNSTADTGTYTQKTPHKHQLTISFGAVSTYPKCRPVIFAKAKHDITEDGESAGIIQNNINVIAGSAYHTLYSSSGRHIAIRNKGNDQGELHCCFAADGGSGKDYVYHGKSVDGGKEWTIERIDATTNCEQIMADIVIDKNNNIHFVWAESDNADPAHRQIKYRKLSSADAWGSVETVSTAGNPYFQADPCIQVKNDGTTIGVAWVGWGWGDLDALDLAYRERTTIAWGAEERITSNADATHDYRIPAVDFDSDDYPHIVADHGNSLVWNDSNIYYWQKTAGGWQAPEQINNDAGDNNLTEHNSNILIDENDYIHVAYITSEAGGTLDVCYKKKARGGAWPAKEIVAANGGTRRHYAPQIQLNGDGNIYCVYTIKYNSNSNYAIAYKTKTTSWQSETMIKTGTGRHFKYAQMLWSRQPLRTGIYQSLSQQYMIVIYTSNPSNDEYVGDIEFFAEPTTVVGDIPDTVTTETYRTKRRGALCKTKFQNKAAPSKIS